MLKSDEAQITRKKRKQKKLVLVDVSLKLMQRLLGARILRDESQ
jgi:hypothetical protein